MNNQRSKGKSHLSIPKSSPGGSWMESKLTWDQSIPNLAARASISTTSMLGGEENSSKANTEPPQVTMTLNRNSGPSSSSSSVPMEFVSKKFQNVVHHQQLPPSTLPPILPLPPQYTKPQQLPIKPVDHVEPPMPPSRNFRGPIPAVSAGDISHQMLNLLSKCNEVVANVTGLLGYVPYHPL